jgi:hypothetical protein
MITRKPVPTSPRPIPTRLPRTALPKAIGLVACLAFTATMLPSCRDPEPGKETATTPPDFTVRVDAVTGMTRGGKPYFIKGAGGSTSLEELAARGGNSIRTWETKGLGELLDQAHALGLTVSAGIWLEPECSWFSYANPDHCAKQVERVRKEVTLHRDHPALLAWGLGNEVEGNGSNTAFWQQLDKLAQLTKELDPSHPTYTALAGAGEKKVQGLMTHTPHLDFLGINTYGGVSGVRKTLEKIGWKKPWILTEWGPRGFWESPKTGFDAPVEQTSSGKEAMIREAYKKVIFPGGGCLGSYAFVWNWKFEATATWFGLYTHEGETTAAVDALQEAWSGAPPANRAPGITRIQGVPKSAVAPGTAFNATTQATDPDADPLTFHWTVLPEHKDKHSNTRPTMPKPVSGTIADPSGDKAAVTAPAKPGIYRLYVWAKDGKGHAATANMPFEVR